MTQPSLFVRVLQSFVVAIVVAILLWVIGKYMIDIPSKIEGLITGFTILYIVGILFAWIPGPKVPTF